VISHGAARLIELRERLFEGCECRIVVELALHEANPLGELVPDILVERCASVLLYRVVHDLRKILVDPVPAGEAHQGEARWKEPPVGEVVHGGHELLARQVAGDPEDDQGTRARDAVESSVGRQAQRIELWSDFHR
jgi:hypothetical protein